MDVVLCYAFDFAMIVVRWITSVKMDVSFMLIIVFLMKRFGVAVQREHYPIASVKWKSKLVLQRPVGLNSSMLNQTLTSGRLRKRQQPHLCVSL